MMYTLEKMHFTSRDMRCSGWLYIPDNVKKPPVIIMGHGFACEKSFRLITFAEKFLAQKMAVFMFDYRFAGDSEGEPRNLVDWRLQLQDWQAAVKYVQSLKQVDSSRIGIWGSSFSGGHVLYIAARNPHIKAVSAHVPFCDGLSTMRMLGWRNVFKASIAGIKDLYSTRFKDKPFLVPVVAPPDIFACLNTPGAYSGYLDLVPPESKWKNQCPARTALYLPFYRPKSAAHRIKCPVLIIMGSQDPIIKPLAVEETAARITDCRLISLPVGHFDSFFGEWFVRVADWQTDFFKEQLWNN